VTADHFAKHGTDLGGRHTMNVRLGHWTMVPRCGGSSPKNRQSRALQLKPGKAASHRAEHLDILNVYG